MCVLRTCVGFAKTDNSGEMNMDMDLMTSNDSVVAELSPTLFDFDSVTDNCNDDDDGLALMTDDVLPDLSALEDFVDLTEFFVSKSL